MPQNYLVFDGTQYPHPSMLQYSKRIEQRIELSKLLLLTNDCFYCFYVLFLVQKDQNYLKWSLK